MPAEVDRKVVDVFCKVFPGAQRLAEDEYQAVLRRGTFEEWDSLGHLLLIAALREEFAVEISPEQALDLETMDDVKRFVRETVAT
jgi:acyl carrier protein